MPLMRRMGRPGLVGMAARTAVVAGTATAVSGHVARRQDERAQEQYMQQQAEMQQQASMTAPAQYAAAPAGGDDMVAQLQQLAQLKAQGALSDAEFEAAKARLLG